jgi:DNA replication and repair protein RecF
MYLRKLSLVNFKNYKDAEIVFSDRINCFIGFNGVGKTNLLDAIHYLALAKSYFNTIDSQNIRHDNDFSVIQGEFVKHDKSDTIYCGVQRNKRKQFKRNKKEYEKISDHIGLFPLVMISPADSNLINEGGEERRKFINGVIAQYDREYLDNVIQYNRALAQRNKLLKDLKTGLSFDRDVLSAWDEQLILYGEKIFNVRKDFIEKLLPGFRDYYNYISDNKEEVKLSYQSQLFEQNMRDLLDNSLRKDLILQYTTAGIHKDELIMNIGGFPLKKTGSQGQQKTFLVALKLAKFDFIKKKSDIVPILLLDDIFDKFDALRVEKIIRLVAENNFGQIFITDTNESHLKSILSGINIDHKIFFITEDQKISVIP